MERFNIISARAYKWFLLSLAASILLVWGCPTTEAAFPGYQRTKAPLISPADAQTVLNMREAKSSLPTDIGILSSTVATPEIQALARGLKNDPDLMFEYVYNNIEYTPVFGCVKGATAVLLDGKGNDFDQSSLLIALLREAGYTANFVYGVVRYTSQVITNWLGIENNVSAVGALLGSAGIPAQIWVDQGGALLYVDMDRVWVKVNIDGTDYVFDPAFKTHIQKQAIDLATAMGYDQSSFFSSALSGATVNTDYIQNTNKANIRSSLATYAANLISHIKTNAPDKGLKDIIGGNIIEPIQTVLRQTSLPDVQSIIAEWTDVPGQYKNAFRIQHLGIDETLYSCDIYGKRLTIFYNTSFAPELRLDGAVIATGTSSTQGSYQNITLSVDHPYAANGGTYCDQARTFQIKVGGSYLVVNGWSEIQRGVVEHHRKKLKENIHAGGDTTSEPILGESLAMIGYTWLAECIRADELSDRMFKNFTVHHHMIGVCGQNESPYIDMPMCLVSVINGEDNPQKESAGFFNGSGHHSAFEWGVIDQLQPYSAVSTVKLVDLSNEKSDKIFDATGANYYSVIKSQLVNFSAYELSHVEMYISAGYRVILPQDGDLGEGQWTGVGFLTLDPSESHIGHIISGGLSGGFGVVDWILGGIDTVFDWFSGLHPQSNEPIDLVTGDYLYEHTDLTIGSGVYPFGLGFKRSYNSGSRLDDGPLGLGWTHNFDITAGPDSDGFQGMGEDSPVDAAAAIVENYVAMDILQGTKTTDRLVIATIAHRWFMDMLIDNIVVVREPGNTSKFVKLPDGTYNPSPGAASVLTYEGDNSYLLQTKHGALLDFDPSGKIASWQDPNNNTVTFTYTNGDLQSVGNGLGRTLSFTYNSGRISQVADGTGRSVDFAYGAAGNLTAVTDCNLNTTSFEYDADGMIARIYYPSNPANPFVTNTYDALGRVQAQTDAEGNTYQYYFSGFRAEEEDPLTNSRTWYFNDQGKTIKDIDALGNETRFAYDAHHRITLKTYPEENSVAYEYDPNHNLTKETLHPKPGSGETPITKSYTYEPTFNRIETSTDPLLNTTTFYYDSKGNLTKIEQPQVNSQTPQTLFTYNSRGQVETIRDQEGMIKGYTYDPSTADLLTVTVDQGGFNLTTQMTYDTVGNVTDRTDPRENTTSFQYDSMRRLKQTTAPMPLNYVTKYSYDPDGNLTKIESETGDVQNPWQTTATTYTRTGKKQTLTDPQGNITTYQYDQIDRLWKITDAKTDTTEYLYDAAGRLYRVIDAKGQIGEEHAYTSNGQKQGLKDANGNITLFEYDDFDRLYRTIYPDASYEELTYDAANNITQKHTRAGQIIGYAYDDLNRLSVKTLPGPTGMVYAYDLTGRLVDVTDPNGTIHHGYDTAGRLDTVTYPGSKTVGYEYDDSSNRIKLIYPDSYFVTYAYDELNRLTQIKENGTTTLAQYTYDPLSRRETLSYGNGTSSDYTYEVDDDLSSMQHLFSGSTATLDYTYDDTHNRSGFATSDDRFIFSPLDDSQNYVSNSLNQYASVNGVSFTYDGNGNLTSDGINTYAYDAENRLVGATTPSKASSYTYDPFGRRISKTVDSVTMSYLHDGDQVIVEYDGSGQMVRRYIYGPGIDQPVCMKTGVALYYYHFDGLGSVIALTDASGDVAETFAYTPYGEANHVSSVGNPYLYTGREYDPETGLYFYRARYYDAKLGRFLQVDPIEFKAGMNLYLYVGNNSINYFDPFGLERLWIKVKERGIFSDGGAYGHSWVTVEDDKGQTTSYGFWPGGEEGAGLEAIFGFEYEGYVSIKSGGSDEGDYTPDSMMEYEITTEQYNNIKSFIKDLKDNKTKWSLDYNCTDVAKEIGNIGGIGIPEISTLGWDDPNKLADWLNKQNTKFKK